MKKLKNVLRNIIWKIRNKYEQIKYKIKGREKK